jgi:hypothetical protein
MVLFVYCGTSFLILPLGHLDPTEGSKPTFDFAGTLTGVTGLILFNFAWNQDAVVGWHVPYTYALMIVGILFFAVFCYIEVNIAENPLVPIKALSKEAVFATLHHCLRMGLVRHLGLLSLAISRAPAKPQCPLFCCTADPRRTQWLAGVSRSGLPAIEGQGRVHHGGSHGLLPH